MSFNTILPVAAATTLLLTACNRQEQPNTADTPARNPTSSDSPQVHVTESSPRVPTSKRTGQAISGTAAEPRNSTADTTDALISQTDSVATSRSVAAAGSTSTAQTSAPIASKQEVQQVLATAITEVESIEKPSQNSSAANLQQTGDKVVVAVKSLHGSSELDKEAQFAAQDAAMEAALALRHASNPSLPADQKRSQLTLGRTRLERARNILETGQVPPEGSQ